MNDTNLQEYAEKRFHELFGDEFKVVGEYKNNYTKLRVQHNSDKCSHFEWEIIPKNIFYKKRLNCPKCSGKDAYLHPENYLTKKRLVELLGKEYTILDRIYGRKDSAMEIQHNCDRCNNHIFYMSPNKILKDMKTGKICPICRKPQIIEAFNDYNEVTAL